MVVVVGAIEIGRHHTDIVGAILSVEVFAVFQAADFRQRVCFVGLFQFRSQEAAFGHGLRSKSRVDAT